MPARSDASGAPALPVAYGRLMSEPLAGRLGAAMQLLPSHRSMPAILRRCAAGVDGRRLSDDDWGSAAAARSSTSSPKAGARATPAPARSASPG